MQKQELVNSLKDFIQRTLPKEATREKFIRQLDQNIDNLNSQVIENLFSSQYIPQFIYKNNQEEFEYYKSELEILCFDDEIFMKKVLKQDMKGLLKDLPEQESILNDSISYIYTQQEDKLNQIKEHFTDDEFLEYSQCLNKFTDKNQRESYLYEKKVKHQKSLQNINDQSFLKLIKNDNFHSKPVDNTLNVQEFIELKPLFEVFVDQSTQYQLEKIHLIKENILQEFGSTVQKIKVVGFYGVQAYIKEKMEILIGQKIIFKNQLDEKSINNTQLKNDLNDGMYPQIQYAKIDNMLILVLIASDNIYLQSYDQNDQIIDFLRIIQDLCSEIFICLPNDFVVNNSNIPFRKVVHSGYIMQALKNTEFKDLRLIRVLNTEQQKSGIENYINSISSKYFMELVIDYNEFKKRKYMKVANYFKNFFFSGKNRLLKETTIDFFKAQKYYDTYIDMIIPEKDPYKRFEYTCEQILYFINENQKQQYKEFTKDLLQKINNFKNSESFQNQNKRLQINSLNCSKIYQLFLEKLFSYVKKNKMYIYTEVDYDIKIFIQTQYINIGKFIKKNVQKFQMQKTKDITYKLNSKIKSIDIKLSNVLFLTDNRGFLLIEGIEENKLSMFKITKKKGEVFNIEQYAIFPKQVQVISNKLERSIIIWNNQKRSIERWKLNEQLDSPEKINLNLYDTKSKEINPENIKSMIYYSQQQKIYFIDDKHQLYNYDIMTQQLTILQQVLNENGSIIKRQIRPQYDEFYDQFLQCENESYILLKCKSFIDIYTISYSLVKSIQINEDFLNCQVIKLNKQYYMIIQYKKDIQFYKVEGGLQDINIEVKKTKKDELAPKGNSILDYFYKSQHKYGNELLFQKQHPKSLSSINQNLFIDIKQYILFKNYAKKLQIQNIKIRQQISQDFLQIDKDYINFLINTRVPLHIASIEQSRLVPLKNGKNNLKNLLKQDIIDFASNKTELINSIYKQISFGVYENILSQYSYPIKVVSIMGPQSSGKSYVLNKLFGTRFNVDSNRCTDGIWMSCSIQEENEQKILYIILDCEGLFNIQRNIEEELRIVLVAIAISDLVILNVQNNFDRKFQEFFDQLQLLANKLESKKLFQSRLLVLVRDVSCDGMNNSQKEFTQIIESQISESKDSLNNIFKTQRYAVQGLVEFQQENFDNYLQEMLKDEYLKNYTVSHWENSDEFLQMFKTVLSQVFIDDDQNTDQIIFETKLKEQFEYYRQQFYDGNELFEENEKEKFNFKTSDEQQCYIYQKDVCLNITQNQYDQFINVQDKNLQEYMQQQQFSETQSLVSFNNESIAQKETDDISIQLLADKLQIKIDTQNQHQVIQEQLSNEESSEDEILDEQSIIEQINNEQSNTNENLPFGFNLQKKIVKAISSKNINISPLNQNLIKVLKDIYQTYDEYSFNNHDIWIEKFQTFCLDILNQRSNITQQKFVQSFEEFTQYRELIEQKKLNLNSIFTLEMQIFNFCLNKCTKCNRKCIKYYGHQQTQYQNVDQFKCDCYTDHECQELCGFDECKKNQNKCSKEPNHIKEHFCRVIDHFCQSICQKKECENRCCQLQNHQDKEHNCGRIHYCIEQCSLNNCNAQCSIQDEVQHDIHKCNIKGCTELCVLCNQKRCIKSEHFHDQYIQQNEKEKLILIKDEKEYILNYHICDQPHHCKEMCQQEGLCEINYKIVEDTKTTNLGQEIVFKRFIPLETKKQCILEIKKYEKDHQSQHICDTNKIHRCDQRCPECDGFCQLDYGHDGKHKTSNHRNKEKNIYLHSKNQNTTKIEHEGRIYEFESGEYTSHEYCNTSCQNKGRAHFHFIQCESKNKCMQKIYPKKAKHSEEKFKPDISKQYDLVLCKYYWEFYNWESPCTTFQELTINKCNFYCGHNSHQASQKSFCTNKAWHSGTHSVTCRHSDYYNKIQVAFVVDNTGSMCPYMNQVKDSINKILQQFQQKYTNSLDLEFGYVGYTDHFRESGINDQNYPVNIIEFTTPLKCSQFVQDIENSGGGDAEAVVDGLKAATQLGWEVNSLKFLFHIGDQPPHGSRFTSGIGDSYPNGCPCNLDIDDYITKINKLKIKYKLMKIGTNLNIYAQYAQQKFNSYEEIFIDCPVNLDMKICKILFNSLDNDIYDARIQIILFTLQQ